ncbi:MAG: hypothetical protein VYE77_00625 [Planctomycetota bacterium]|nr:hypothetical protein [Planctomycetota bacterium]
MTDLRQVVNFGIPVALPADGDHGDGEFARPRSEAWCQRQQGSLEAVESVAIDQALGRRMVPPRLDLDGGIPGPASHQEVDLGVPGAQVVLDDSPALSPQVPSREALAGAP